MKKLFIVFALLGVSVAAAYSQDCKSYLQQAENLMADEKHCEAVNYFKKYASCNADADVRTEIAMCERRCRIPGGGENENVRIDTQRNSDEIKTKSTDNENGTRMAIGGKLVLIGVGAKFQYNVSNQIRLDASITHVTAIILKVLDFSVTGHYLFPVSNKVTLYPLVGFTICNYSLFGLEASEYFVAFGGGIDIKLTNKLLLNFDFKYPSPYLGMMSVGLAHRF